jgi:hypothetical protein
MGAKVEQNIVFIPLFVAIYKITLFDLEKRWERKDDFKFIFTGAFRGRQIELQINYLSIFL